MNPIFVAIDTPELDRALHVAQAVHGHAGGLKLGLEFFAAQGPGGVARVAALGLPLFLDLKLHDIPNTVGKAVEALAPLKPAILTVHAAGVQGSAAEQVERLTRLARDSGIDGIVCSGAEVAAASSLWPGGFFVVPGIRPAGADVADQKRVVTPRQALDDGASVLVIGRPITGAADPGAAIAEIAASLKKEVIE